MSMRTASPRAAVAAAVAAASLLVGLPAGAQQPTPATVTPTEGPPGTILTVVASSGCEDTDLVLIDFWTTVSEPGMGDPITRYTTTEVAKPVGQSGFTAQVPIPADTPPTDLDDEDGYTVSGLTAECVASESPFLVDFQITVTAGSAPVEPTAPTAPGSPEATPGIAPGTVPVAAPAAAVPGQPDYTG